MKTALDKVKEFHTAFGHPVADKLGFPDSERIVFRFNLIAEEMQELAQAIRSDKDIVDTADAMADLVYVVCGAALEFGIPLDKVFDEVHAANMRKLGVDGKPIYREDGKIMKPEDWTPPDIKAVL